MVRRLTYEDEQKILDELDYLIEQTEFNRENAVWCSKIIKKLLLELHFMRNDIINKNT
ncbi:hypothetical protein MHB40_14485 [Lysinibacillus sp. FSL K6-0057]|uniref:hypothetical protein n=1 Tax=Lysinibacillus sp. FSL K6-0057 TaxID=2921411 RepID=UPI003159B8FF